jgi:small ligand-binding sensory domain FIST
MPLPKLKGGSMKWVSALSTYPSLEAALDDVIGQAQQSLNAPADLAIVFISTSFTSEYPRLLPLLNERLEVAKPLGPHQKLKKNQL